MRITKKKTRLETWTYYSIINGTLPNNLTTMTQTIIHQYTHNKVNTIWLHVNNSYYTIIHHKKTRINTTPDLAKMLLTKIHQYTHQYAHQYNNITIIHKST
uniref:Uncharacterized protein n=1 Tax=Cephea cephea TaxID=880218 RepID=A0AAU6W678_9CNID